VRKAVTIIIPVLLALLAAAQFTACEKYVLPAISIDPDTLRFTAAADSAQIQLVTNVITSPSTDENVTWISAWPNWFDADSPVTIYVEENASEKERSGIMYFKSEALQRKLVVIQEGKK
jgi:hypothetical protein